MVNGSLKGIDSFLNEVETLLLLGEAKSAGSGHALTSDGPSDFFNPQAVDLDFLLNHAGEQYEKVSLSTYIMTKT